MARTTSCEFCGKRVPVDELDRLKKHTDSNGDKCKSSGKPAAFRIQGKDSITTDKRVQLHRALDHVLDSRKGRARDIDRWKSEEEISKTLSERQLMQAYADCFKDDPFNKGLNDDDAFKLMRRRLVGRAKDHVLDSRKGRAKDSSGVTIKGITFTDAEVARYPRKVLEWSAKTGREPWSYNGDKPQYPASKQAKDFDLGATWDAANINRRRAWLEEVVARVSENSAQGVWNQLSKPWASVSKPVKARLEQYAAAKILR